MSTTENEPHEPENKPKLFWLERFGMKTQNRRFWNSNKLLSLFAFLISLGTFTTFAYQTYLIRKQQYASVMPYLMINNSKSSNSDYSIQLFNNGIGPAFIKEIKIHYEGKVYDYGPSGFIRFVINSQDSINVGGWEPYPGLALPAGQIMTLVNSQDERAASALIELFDGNQGKAKIEITYSPIYDEKWIIKPPSLVPEKLE